MMTPDAGEAQFPSDSSDELAELLGRPPTTPEESAWRAMSPSLRRRAGERILLMQRWIGHRDGLTASDAAAMAGVNPKRFYQMAAAWKKDPGLAAVGAYASAPPERRPRIDPRINMLLQANVARVVAEHPGESIESVRRHLEDAARRQFSRFEDGAELQLPSMNVTRGIIQRELHRVHEMTLLGESLALDCCATTMRRPDGAPHVLFALVDRGTRRIVGHALGSVESSISAYGRAAAAALAWISGAPATALPWASATRRLDVVLGADDSAWEDLLRRWRANGGLPELGEITNERRYGSQYRKYVGDRIGRVVLRPTWTTAAPPMDADAEIFDDRDAAARVALEIAAYNDSEALSPAGSHADEPPPSLVAALQFLVG